jgi:hypothetical protein
MIKHYVSWRVYGKTLFFCDTEYKSVYNYFLKHCPGTADIKTRLFQVEDVKNADKMVYAAVTGNKDAFIKKLFQQFADKYTAGCIIRYTQQVLREHPPKVNVVKDEDLCLIP